MIEINNLTGEKTFVEDIIIIPEVIPEEIIIPEPEPTVQELLDRIKVLEEIISGGN